MANASEESEAMKDVIAPPAAKMPFAPAAGPASAATTAREESVEIPLNGIFLAADLAIPAEAAGVVIFAHGSGSSRRSPRNKFVARQIQAAGIGTLLLDLLTEREERKDVNTGYWRFDIELLTHRLERATRWLGEHPVGGGLRPGYFGASTGAAAALVAAANLGARIGAVVSRGGRPDFAGDALGRVIAPTLFIVGERDEGVLSLNRGAYWRLACEKQFAVVPHATHLFEEPGALEEVAALATAWFSTHLNRREQP